METTRRGGPVSEGGVMLRCGRRLAPPWFTLRTIRADLCEGAHGIRCAAMPRKRLDAVMAERGLFESRTRAAAAVMAGEVRVAGEPARKPGQLVGDDAEISV